jgi:hypothetical protein
VSISFACGEANGQSLLWNQRSERKAQAAIVALGLGASVFFIVDQAKFIR